MHTNPILNKWKLFFQWVLANTIGMIVAVSTMTILIILFIVLHVELTIIAAPNKLFTTNEEYIFSLTAAYLIIIIFSVIIATFQWFVLRTQIDNAKKWIWISSIGLSIGLLTLSAFNNYLLNFNKYLIGAIIGVAIGIAQWLVFRKKIKFSSLWVLINVIGISMVIQVVWN